MKRISGAASAPALVAPLGAAAAGLLLGLLLTVLFGARLSTVLSLVASETLGSGYGIGQILFRATPLLFAGLAVALPLRAGLLNIGAEGQMTIGGFAMAIAGVHLAGMPGPWLWLVCVAAGALAGGLWGGIAGVLKARTGAHEVIVTILLNFVAAALVNYLLVRGYALPETVRTPTIGEGGWMARASDLFGFFRGSGLSTALPFGLAVAAACDLLLLRTGLGFAWRILAGGGKRARYARLQAGRLTVLSLALGGALAGLGGTSFILGQKRYFEEGFVGGAGFLGIAVALLARNRPIAVPATACLFGFLAQAGLSVNRIVPRELVDVIVGAILIVFVVLDARAREQEPARHGRGVFGRSLTQGRAR